MKPASLARWSLCFAAALGLHAGGAAALMAHWSNDADQLANAPVIMLDLAPVAAAPQTTPSEVPPDSVARQMQTGAEKAPDKPNDVVEKTEPLPEPEKPIEEARAEPEPEKPADIKPEPQAELPMPPRPVEKTDERPDDKKKKEVRKKPQPRRAMLAAAPSSADRRAERAAAPAVGANRDADALPNWKSRLFAQIERYKRYPAEAQARGDRGVVKLAFSVDRQGGVHNARVVGSSGSLILDHETLAMIERAAPLPAPPADLPGARITVVVPISYSIR